jgi:hypothetical protein
MSSDRSSIAATSAVGYGPKIFPDRRRTLKVEAPGGRFVFFSSPKSA